MEENPLIGHTLRGGGEGGGGGTDRSKFYRREKKGFLTNVGLTHGQLSRPENGQCLGQSIFIFIYFC